MNPHTNIRMHFLHKSMALWTNYIAQAHMLPPVINIQYKYQHCTCPVCRYHTGNSVPGFSFCDKKPIVLLIESDRYFLLKYRTIQRQKNITRHLKFKKIIFKPEKNTIFRVVGGRRRSGRRLLHLFKSSSLLVGVYHYHSTFYIVQEQKQSAKAVIIISAMSLPRLSLPYRELSSRFLFSFFTHGSCSSKISVQKKKSDFF